MIQDFNNKTAVVTGGTHGIGFAMAQTCLELGMNVVITGSRPESAAEAEARLGAPDRLLALASNAGELEANQELARQTEQRFGGVNLLCLNAGISRLAPIHELTPETWRQHMAVNLDGPFYGVKAFLPLLEQQHEAHIVITSSVFALFATAMQAPYFASKAGVTAFAESLWYDLQAAESSVGVSVACPGNTRTNMAEANLTGDEDPELAAMVRQELANGSDPLVVTDAILRAVRDNQFYVLPNTGEFQACIEARFDRVLKQRNPSWEDVGDAV